MNKAVLIAAALVLAPAASLGQGVTDRKDREPPSVRKRRRTSRCRASGPRIHPDPLSEIVRGSGDRSNRGRFALPTLTISAARSRPARAVSQCACGPTKTS